MKASDWAAINPLLLGIAQRFGVTLRELRGKRRLKRYVQARAAAVVLLRDRGLIWADISLIMGGRDRSTLIHAYRVGKEAAVVVPSDGEVSAELRQMKEHALRVLDEVDAAIAKMEARQQKAEVQR